MKRIKKYIGQTFVANPRGFISIILLALVGVAAFVPVLTYFYFARDLNTRDTIMNRKNTGVILLDRNNKPFFKFYSAHFESHKPLSQIPKVTQEAIISAEDREFYQHPGFSIKGIV